MSAAANVPPDLDDEFQEAVITLHTAQEGDDVLYGDRANPLVVTDTGGTPGEDRYIVLQGPRGGTYTIREKYNRNGTPAFTTSESGHPANDLHFAETDAEEGASDGSDPGGSVDESPNRDLSAVGFNGSINASQDGNVLTVSGYSESWDTAFDLLYDRPSADDPWSLDADDSGFGDLDTFSDRSGLAGEVEDALEDAGYEVSRATFRAELEQDLPDAPDMGHPWPTIHKQEPDAEEQDIDEHVSDIVDDPIYTYEELLRELNRHPTIEPPESFFDREAPGWTFVDELVAFGQEVPKSVNNWELVDYGVVYDTEFRKLVWLNAETDEMVALSAVSDEGTVSWNVYHTEDIMEMADEEIQPTVTTDDPFEALDEVVDLLYGRQRNLDVEVIERRDGEIVVVEATDRRSLGSRLFAKFGVDLAIPALPGEKSLAEGFSLGGLLQDSKEFLAENRQALGTVGLLVAEIGIYGIRRATFKRLPQIDVFPVVDYDELGIAAQYRYEGDRADWLKGEAFQTKFTIDPDRFNLRERSKYWTGKEYEDLVNASQVLGGAGVDLVMKTNTGKNVGTRRAGGSPSGSGAQRTHRLISRVGERTGETVSTGGRFRGEERTEGVEEALEREFGDDLTETVAALTFDLEQESPGGQRGALFDSAAEWLYGDIESTSDIYGPDDAGQAIAAWWTEVAQPAAEEADVNIIRRQDDGWAVIDGEPSFTTRSLLNDAAAAAIELGAATKADFEDIGLTEEDDLSPEERLALGEEVPSDEAASLYAEMWNLDMEEGYEEFTNPGDRD